MSKRILYCWGSDMDTVIHNHHIEDIVKHNFLSCYHRQLDDMFHLHNVRIVSGHRSLASVSMDFWLNHHYLDSRMFHQDIEIDWVYIA